MVSARMFLIWDMGCGFRWLVPQSNPDSTYCMPTKLLESIQSRKKEEKKRKRQKEEEERQKRGRCHQLLLLSTMILVWSSENGGPLQIAGLALFLLQIIAQIAPTLFDGPTFVQLLVKDQLILLILLVAVVIGMVGFVGVMLSDYPPVGNRNREEEEGTAANPVDVDAQDESNETTNNDDVTGNSGIMNSIRRSVENFNSHYLMLTSAFILPLSMVIPILINVGGSGIMSSTAGTISLAVVALAAHACMALAAYGVLREYLSGAADFPGNRRGNTVRARKYTVAEMADLVRKIAVEEYVSEDDITNGECSISKLKRMLCHRGAGGAAKKCLEKDELTSELLRVRKHEKECTICSEDYAEG